MRLNSGGAEGGAEGDGGEVNKAEFRIEWRVEEEEGGGRSDERERG